jgi:hypothetical protein
MYGNIELWCSIWFEDAISGGSGIIVGGGEVGFCVSASLVFNQERVWRKEIEIG